LACCGKDSPDSLGNESRITITIVTSESWTPITNNHFWIDAAA
jgi:hypothetical protein